VTFPIGIETKRDLINVAPLILNCVLTVPAVKVSIVPLNKAIYALA
jgi:hypothetical protein